MADIQLTFAVQIPVQRHDGEFESDKSVGKAKKTALNAVKVQLDQLLVGGGDAFVVLAMGPPGTPPKILNEDQTFDEQEVASGAQLTMRPR